MSHECFLHAYQRQSTWSRDQPGIAQKSFYYSIYISNKYYTSWVGVAVSGVSLVLSRPERLLDLPEAVDLELAAEQAELGSWIASCCIRLMNVMIKNCENHMPK